MEWEELKDAGTLDKINEVSKEQPVLIFKHSTRCSISDTALNRLERNWKKDEAKGVVPYYLDLISFRDISNKIAEVYDVKHESPQALLIVNGACVYYASHMGINLNEILSNVPKN
ncbi:bacillithiol system redox-active protein YtxJ [Cytophagaceae bacterium ABcell3]|nr:bacillithiol system redox-active protein YtxJ [Cytophagaceae bacterium ABcell3]